MKHFHSDKLGPMSALEQHLIYNALDSALTHEIFEIQSAELNPGPNAYQGAQAVYDFERSLVPCVLTMMGRGIPVNQEKCREAVEGPGGLNDRIKRLRRSFFFLAQAVLGKPRNKKEAKSRKKIINSHLQLKHLFYEALCIPPIVAHKKGDAKVSVDRDALEKIEKEYSRGLPFARLLLAIRDLEKQRDTLTKKLDADGRFRFSINISGTDTGRFSSSESPFRTGSNIQNIDPALRGIFVPDPGYRLVYIDLQGAEARGVAYLSGDKNYIDAVESSDCHTLVASMVFGIPAERKEADKLFYRNFSFRDMAKRGAHGSSYMGTPRTMAIHLKVETSLMEDFQYKFFKRFPGIREWHHWVGRQLQSEGYIDTPMGRRRWFWSRLRDDSTLRKAIAFQPQSTIADVLNTGMREIHTHLEPKGFQLFAQIHDAILGQVPLGPEGDVLIGDAIRLLEIPIKVIDIHGIERTMLIPAEAQWGLSWHKKDLHSWTASAK